jgi:TolB-like protein
MRYVDRLFVVLTIGFGWLGSPTWAQQPTTQPSEPAARILVLPFTAMNASEQSSWLGRSIQQSLLADLTIAAPGRLLSADGEAADTVAAVAAGKKSQADFVIIGSFTTIDLETGKQLRIAGQLVDVEHQSALAGFKVTGMYADIFQLEDQVGRQIRHRLSDAGAIRVPVIALGPSTTPEPVEIAQAPTINEYQQAYGNPQPMIGGAADSGYNYYYGDPYYSGGYDLSYGPGYPLFIYGGGFYGNGSRGFGRGGFRDGGFGHGGGSHGGGSHASGHGHR